MDHFQVIVLALIQGFTEFLPISSSGHLVLVPQILGWGDQGLAFDVAVHVGTLLAVLAYFRRELVPIVGDTVGTLVGKSPTESSHLGWAVVIATIPVGLVGLLFKSLIEAHLRGAIVVGLATIIFGLVLGWADIKGKQRRELSSLRWRDALLIGLAQAVALIPGTSRSGITMTAGLMLGFKRDAAVRFSFLMAIPTIALAGGLLVLDVIAEKQSIEWSALLLGIVVSGLTAYACIHWFLGFVERIGMQPFVLYRLLLGGLILALFY